MGGGNLQKTCAICLRTMKGDNLKGHMKCHEKINSIDEAETHRREKSSDKCTNIDLEKLKSECFAINQEFEMKIELGRNLKRIINEEGFNIHAFPGNMKEALETYGYGRN